MAHGDDDIAATRALSPAAIHVPAQRVVHAPYTRPAAGLPAVWSSFRYAQQTSGVVRGLRVFLQVNQADGFDCPGCAWPDPEHRAAFEFCENGARAVAHEADARRVDAAFFARHSLDALSQQSDHALEHNGRLTEPMVKLPGASHYTPIGWAEACALVGETLRALPSPDAAAFYTSGRASNEAAFLYQLFARAFGTNNLPDCSNLCHESSGKGLLSTIGVGKGTVQLADFEHADCIFLFGQNPGTNHPRMLSTLQQAAARGCKIISVNPLKERGAEEFAHPQQVLGILGQGSAISTHHVQVRINGDVAFLKGVMKTVLALEDARGGVLDHAFLAEHARGLPELLASVRATSWEAICAGSGLSRAQIEEVGNVYAASRATIACWAMGLTQHKNGVANVREVVNLLALRGNFGRAGAGVCPVRGHSNVQGDRTMGIYEAPTEAFLAKLDAATGIRSPRAPGHDVVASIAAMERGDVRAFVALGGNFVMASPDTARVARAVAKCTLTVHIATKLNRSHLVTGDTALLLPCLGRTEIDLQPTPLRSDGPQPARTPQFVTVENSMGVVHASQGRLSPGSAQLRSEPWIVAALAHATLGATASVPFMELVADYDRIRALIEKAVDGFSGFNARVRHKNGFVLDNGVRDRRFDTASGKLELTAQPLPEWTLAPEQLLLMTIRTHDQFNTTIYTLDDRYRGLYGERRVILMHRDDAAARGLVSGDWVDITSHFAGTTRVAQHFAVVPYDIPRGCVATYFPETNVLVPLLSQADESGTPTSKSIVVTLQKERAAGVA